MNPDHTTDNLSQTRKAMQLELRKIGSELQEAYDHQWKLRQEFSTYLSQKRQQEGLPTAKAIEAIAKEKRLQNTYSRLRYARKGGKSSSSITLQAPSGTMTVDEMWNTLKVNEKKVEAWSEVCNDDKVDLLLQWSARHYSQAHSSPFATGHLSKALDSAEHINEILNVTFDTTGYSKEVASFL